MSVLRFLDATGGPVLPYVPTWNHQRDLHAARAADEIADTVLLLEHEPVFTAGKRTEDKDRPWDGTPVVEVDRGGKITWHGPGQLTGYPIVKLPERVYVVDYVRRLEAAIIAVCADLGLEAGQVSGRSGVWLPGNPERKVAAIGVRVAKGVTMHGFAINCGPDLSWFSRIVPCGIDDAAVTSLTHELGFEVSVTEIVPLVQRRLAEAFGAADVEIDRFALPEHLATAEPVAPVIGSGARTYLNVGRAS